MDVCITIYISDGLFFKEKMYVNIIVCSEREIERTVSSVFEGFAVVHGGERERGIIVPTIFGHK